MAAKNVLIVGYGVVGHNLARELNQLHPDIYDKFKTEYNTKRDIKYDFCFICVDTPYVSKEVPCDRSAVFDAIRENDADIYIIKSTVLPRTTEMLNKQCKKKVIFSPEYYGGTQHCNNFTFNFTILGGAKEYCYKVQQLLQEVYDGTHIFKIVNSVTAEVAKYRENVRLFMKVRENIEFWKLCKKLNIPYEELRECDNLDPRNNSSHTFVYDEHPYTDSHCLNKDVPAIAYTYDMELIIKAYEMNEEDKKKYKEE